MNFLKWKLLFLGLLLCFSGKALAQAQSEKGSTPAAPHPQVANLKAEIEMLKRTLVQGEASRQAVQEKLLKDNSGTELDLRETIERIDRQMRDSKLISDPAVLSQLALKRVDLLLEIQGLEIRLKFMGDAASKEEDSRRRLYHERLELKKQLLELQEKRLAIVKERVQKLATATEQIEAEINLRAARLELVEIEAEMASTLKTDQEMARISMELAIKKSQLEKVESLLAGVFEARALTEFRNSMFRELEKLRLAREEGKGKVLSEIEATIANQQAYLAKLEMDLQILLQTHSDSSKKD